MAIRSFKPRSKLRICLDESIVSAHHADLALELGSCRPINIKPGRVGGLTEARRIHDLCAARGLIGCWVGGMLESGVGGAICTALASLANCSYPADIFPATRFYRHDVAEAPLDFVREGEASSRSSSARPELCASPTSNAWTR